MNSDCGKVCGKIGGKAAYASGKGCGGIVGSFPRGGVISAAGCGKRWKSLVLHKKMHKFYYEFCTILVRVFNLLERGFCTYST